MTEQLFNAPKAIETLALALGQSINLLVYVLEAAFSNLCNERAFSAGF